MADLTVSFQLGSLRADTTHIHQILYNCITSIDGIEEADIVGLQLYPADWPRKVQIATANPSAKQILLSAGLDINGKHIDLHDDVLSGCIKITVQDVPLYMSTDDITNIFSEFGEVKMAKYEYVVTSEGRTTRWRTGTIYVYMASITYPIPQKLSTSMYSGLPITLSVKYRTPTMAQPRKCSRCGRSDHQAPNCPSTEKLCFLCHSSEHVRKDCPQYTPGERWSEGVVLFKGNNSVLSNFNMTCPIKIDGDTYNSTEQYIQYKKAMLFDDYETAEWILQSDNPKEIKLLGNNVANYRHSRWLRVCDKVVAKCVKEKFFTHTHASNALLATSERVIGEATSSTHWGIGISIENDEALNISMWSGSNVMGKILMEIRKQLQAESQIDNLISVMTTADSPPEASSTLESDTHAVSPELPPDDTPHDHDPDPDTKHWAVVIGDSNCRDLKTQKQDHYKVELIASGGLSLSDVEDELEKVTPLPDDVHAVVLHVGTCDFSEAENDLQSLYTEYVEVLNSVSTKYRHANILISSIPPRVPKPTKHKSNHGLNVQIKTFNDMLEKMTRKEENITFIDNSLFLSPDGEVASRLYRKTDYTGVHLNNAGIMSLSKSICDSLQENHFKNKLKEEWNVVAKA